MNKICRTSFKKGNFKFICIIHNPLAWKIDKRVVLNKSLYTGKKCQKLRCFTRLFGTQEYMFDSLERAIE